MGRNLESLFDRYRRKGDVRALALVFDRTARDLLALANHLVRDLDDAEDLVQSTFVIAIDRAQSYDRGRALLPWLTGILVHNAANHVRRRERRRTEAVPPLEGKAPDPARRAEEAELTHALDQALGRMGERYRRVLEPYLRRGETPDEIARKLDLAPGTVRTQIHRGLARLRRLLPASVSAGLVLHGGHGLSSVRAAVLEHAGPGSAAAGSAAAALTVTHVVVLGGLIVSKKIALVGAGAVLATLGAWWIPSRTPEPGEGEPQVSVQASAAPVPQLEAPASTVAVPARRRIDEVASDDELSPPPAGRAIVHGRVRGIGPEHLASLSIKVQARLKDLAADPRQMHDLDAVLTDLTAFEQASALGARYMTAQAVAEELDALKSDRQRWAESRMLVPVNAATNLSPGSSAVDEALFEIDVTESLLDMGEQGPGKPLVYRIAATHELYFGQSSPLEFQPGSAVRVAQGEVVTAEIVIDLTPAALLRGKVLLPHAEMLLAQMDRLREVELKMVELAERDGAQQAYVQMRDLQAQMQEVDRINAGGLRNVRIALFRAGEPEPVAETRPDGAGNFHFKLTEEGPRVLAVVANRRAPLQRKVDLRLAAAIELEDQLEFSDDTSLEGFVEHYGAFPEGGLTLEAVRVPSPADGPMNWRGVDVVWHGETVVRDKATAGTSKDGKFRFVGLSEGLHVVGLPADVARTFGAGRLKAMSMQVPVPSTDVSLAFPLAVIDLKIEWPEDAKGSGAARLFTKTGSNDRPLPGTSGGRNRTSLVLAEPGQPVSLIVRHPGMTFEPWSGKAPERGGRSTVRIVGRNDAGQAND